MKIEFYDEKDSAVKSEWYGTLTNHALYIDSNGDVVEIISEPWEYHVFVNRDDLSWRVVDD